MEPGGVEPGLSSVVTAAHELKSPLVLMRQLALNIANGSLTNSQKQQNLDQLVAVANRSLNLTNNLTRTSRLQPELLQLEPVNAWQLCDGVVKNLEPLYRAHGRTIRLDGLRTKPPVVAHPDLLSQVVYHFADNALYYGDNSDDVVISLRVRQRDRRLRIGVRDHGPAMSLQEWRQARQVEPRPLSSRPLSSGLGLFIAERFTEAMAGQIGLVRHRDGATFFVEMPLSEQLSLL